jgi:hypothetical protein
MLKRAGWFPLIHIASWQSVQLVEADALHGHHCPGVDAVGAGRSKAQDENLEVCLEGQADWLHLKRWATRPDRVDRVRASLVGLEAAMVAGAIAGWAGFLGCVLEEFHS